MLQEEGLAVCIKEGDWVGAGRAVEVDTEVGGPSDLCHRPEWAGHLPQVPRESSSSGPGAGDPDSGGRPTLKGTSV